MKNTLYFFLFLFVLSCGPAKDSDSSATDLVALQEQAKELEANVKQLQQTSNQIQIQGRGLTPEEITLTETIDELVESYSAWKTKWEGKTITEDNRKDWKAGLDQLTEQVDEVLDLAAE